MLLSLSAVLFSQEIYQRTLLLKVLKATQKELIAQKEVLEGQLRSLEEQTEAFAACGDATEFSARYDFGLKKKNEEYVHILIPDSVIIDDNKSTS